MSRSPATDHYDAVVGLEPGKPGDTPVFAYALVKCTFVVDEGEAVPAKPEPLEGDVYGDENLQPRFPPGSDYWLHKTATDVVVRGSAHQPGGRPGPSMRVSARVGNVEKQIAIFGRRTLMWRADGWPEIPPPAPFTEMPLIYGNAYGGMDPRAPMSEADRQAFIQLASAGMAVDHPGLYPRNAVGKGYLIYPAPIEGLEMPNLEDPSDLLTRERLVVGSPELWYRQPFPWCFEWTNGLMYPRELYAGFDAWYPCRDDAQLAEVRRGLLPAGLAGRPATTGAMPSEYYQEASLGMVLRTPPAGHPVVLSGMHPEEPEIRFVVPPDPSIEIELEGRRETPQPLLTSLVLRPAEKTFTAVYCVKTESLHRAFIPGIHDGIPLSVSINRGAAIRYVSPPTVRDRLAAARIPPS